MTGTDDDVARTWDGEPISPTPPTGAVIVVYRWIGQQAEFLILHRGQNGPDFEGDWAWGPPAGARYPGEEVDRCAERELCEETGLQLTLQPTDAGTINWVVYLAEAPGDADVRLSPEHDRYAWLPLDEATERVGPEVVRAQLIGAACLHLTADSASIQSAE